MGTQLGDMGDGLMKQMGTNTEAITEVMTTGFDAQAGTLSEQAKSILDVAGNLEGLSEEQKAQFETVADAFDAQGNLIGDTVDAMGNTVKNSLDAQGNLITQKFDTQGNLIGQTQTGIHRIH